MSNLERVMAKEELNLFEMGLPTFVASIILEFWLVIKRMFAEYFL